MDSASALPRAAAFLNHLTAFCSLLTIPSPDSESIPRRYMASAEPSPASLERMDTALFGFLWTPSPAISMSASLMPALP